MVAYNAALATSVQSSGCTTHESEARNKDPETIAEQPEWGTPLWCERLMAGKASSHSVWCWID